MRKLTDYKTADSKYFEDEKQARAQAQVDIIAFKEWHQEHPLLSHYEDEGIPWDDFLQYLHDYSYQVKNIINPI